jgi:TP901 family phage tail tape measure protein
MELFKLVGKIMLDGVESVKSSLEEVSNKAAAVGDKFTKTGEKLSSAGQKLMPITLAVGGLATAIVKTSADFEAGMSQVAAISGATGEDLEALTEKAKEMGAKTKFSATESAEALNYMAMAGWKTDQMIGGLEGIMNLAAASGEDLATTSDIVTDALTAFGMTAEDSSHFADILATASSNANTNVSMMGETFKYVAPVAGALGFSAEDCATAIGLMANAGIKGSQAGTSLRSMFTRLAAPPKECAEAMDALGISITNSDGSMKDLNEVMGDLRKAFDGLGEAEAAEMAKNLAGQEAMSGLLAIVNASEEDYNKLSDAIYNCNGSAESMAATMQDNLQGQLTILKSQVEGVAIQLGEVLVPIVKDVVAQISEWVTWFANLDQGTQKTIMKIAGVVAAIGPLLIVLGKLSTGIGSVLKIGSSLGSVFGGATGPLLAIVAAIALLVAAFKDLWDNNEEFRNNITAAWEEIQTQFGELMDSIMEALIPLVESMIEQLKPIIEQLVPVILDAISQFIQLIGQLMPFILELAQQLLPIIFEVINLLLPLFMQIISTIMPTLSSLLSMLLPVLSSLIQSLTPILEMVIALVAPILNLISQAIQPIMDAILQLIQSALWVLQPILDTLISTLGEILPPIINALMPIIAGIINAIAPVIEIISGLIFVIVETLMPAFQAVANQIKTVLVAAFKFIEPIVQNAMDIFSAIVNFLADVFKGDWEAAWNDILDIFKGIFNQLPALIEGVLNGAIALINELIDGINDITDTVGIPEIPNIPEVTLPRFAKGGVLEDGARTIIAGEDGAEAIVPLEKNREWIARVSNEMQNQGIGDDPETTSVLKEILAALQNMENLPEELTEAMADSLVFKVGNREFARMVKAV